MIQDARGWCTGITQRDGMGREVGEGKARILWENGTETCKLPHVKRIASPCSMHDTGRSGLLHWDYPEGWNGEGSSGWGTHVHP